MRIALRLGLSVVAATLFASQAFAQQNITVADLADGLPVKNVSFSFEGPFGTYDTAALQRGFQIYKEVCSTCHSLNRVAFIDLAKPGGPGFTEAQVKAIAAGYKIPAGPNKQGQLFDANGQRLTRPGRPADHFPPPFPNKEAAATALGVAPPDLSLVAKSLPGGPARIYSILTGFGQKQPAGFHLAQGKYYNPYFPGGNISMPPPLTDGAVTYSDGTKATLDQEAHDVATFLMWAAEPTLDQRKRLGLEVLIFLVVLSGLLYLSYRRIWKDAH